MIYALCFKIALWPTRNSKRNLSSQADFCVVVHFASLADLDPTYFYLVGSFAKVSHLITRFLQEIKEGENSNRNLNSK